MIKFNDFLEEKKVEEETGTAAVAGAGDDSSTVVVKKKDKKKYEPMKRTSELEEARKMPKEWEAGYSHGVSGSGRDRRASAKYGPNAHHYDAGYAAGRKDKEKQYSPRGKHQPDMFEGKELDEVSSNLLRRAADRAAKKGEEARQRGMTAAHGLQSTKAHGDEAEKRAKQRGKFSRASTDKMKKELGINEESPLQALKNKAGEIINKKNYEAALDLMNKKGKSAADAARMYKGVDARTLQKHYETQKEETEMKKFSETWTNPLRKERERKEREDAAKRKGGNDQEYSKRLKKKMYGNMMGGLKEDADQLDESVDTVCKKLNSPMMRRMDAEDVVGKLSQADYKDISRNKADFMKMCKHPEAAEIYKQVAEIEGIREGTEMEQLEEGKKLRNVLTDREFEKSMKKALADKANYKGGKVNWSFIDADVYMELSAKGYDLRHPSVNYMKRFDDLADKLDPETVKESVELEEAKGKLVKNMRVKHMYTGKKGTVIKGGDRAGGRVEVEWEDGNTNVVAGKYLEKFKESVELEEAFNKGDSVTVNNARKYDSLSKPQVSGTVIGKMGSKVMVKVGSGQMNVDPKDLVLEATYGFSPVVAKGQKAKDYMAKRAQDRRDMNQKNDPGAAKKHLALSVLDKEKARAKAKKKGANPSEFEYATGAKPNKMTMIQKGLDPKKARTKKGLPEELEKELEAIKEAARKRLQEMKSED